MTKYTYNETLFDKIDNPISAYLLGVWATDGYIRAKYAVELKVASIDKDFLVKIQECFGGGGVHHATTKLNGKVYHADVFSAYSNYLVDALSKYGIVPNKSLTLCLPACISDEHMSDFIRGAVDGDGCLDIHSTSDYPRLKLDGGAFRFVDGVRKYLNSKFGLKANLTTYAGGKNPYYTVQYNSKEAVILSDYLYHNACLSLPRKRTKYYEFMQHYAPLYHYTPGTWLDYVATDYVRNRKNKQAI